MASNSEESATNTDATCTTNSNVDPAKERKEKASTPPPKPQPNHPKRAQKFPFNFGSGNFPHPSSQAAPVVMYFEKSQNIHIGHNFTMGPTFKQSIHCKDTGDVNKMKKENIKFKMPPVKISQHILDSQQELDRRIKYFIAENIGKSWKEMARFLPPDGVFTDGDIDSIEYKHRDDLKEMVYDILNDWGNRAPDHASVGSLAKTLQKINCPEIAENLKTFLK